MKFFFGFILVWAVGCGKSSTFEKKPVAPTVHRAESTLCDNERLPGNVLGSGAFCEKDEDCTEGNNGRCVRGQRGGNWCTYDTCFKDSECDQVCVCEGKDVLFQGNYCLAGNCATDSDCGDNFCSPTQGECGNHGGTVGYFCHTLEDECTNDEDCVGAASGASSCRFMPELEYWTCQKSQCVG